MSHNKIAVVVGTRPEIIKMQPIVKEIEKRKELELLFVHTGQHYDWNMSHIFIRELELPDPSVFLNVKSGSHGVQTARLIVRSERMFKKEKPDIVLVEGDTNSALGVALAASKLKIPIGHIEAGCRSFDKNMPEEINRILISDLAFFHFAPTKICVQNLLKEGISKEHIYFTGHPLVDLLYRIQNKINEKKITKFGLKTKEYYLLTMHREENVNNKETLKNILDTISIIAKTRQIIFPIHPRTYRYINKFRFNRYLKNIKVTEPLGYLDSLSLIKYAKIVLTDSGGIQQESALLGTPCVTLRSSTEWIETINYGINFLAKSNKEIIKTVEKIENNYDFIVCRTESSKNIYGKPYVSARIVDIIMEKLLKNIN